MDSIIRNSCWFLALSLILTGFASFIFTYPAQAQGEYVKDYTIYTKTTVPEQVKSIEPIVVITGSTQPSVENLQAKINTLLAEIESLKSEIASLRGTPNISVGQTSLKQTYAQEVPVNQISKKQGIAGQISFPPSLTSTLHFGLSDANTNGEVSKLQKFLANYPSIYPEGMVTGYFGSLTEAAVKRYQARNNIVSTGDAKNTGYGVVGPKTRTAIEQESVPNSVDTTVTVQGSTTAKAANSENTSTRTTSETNTETNTTTNTATTTTNVITDPSILGGKTVTENRASTTPAFTPSIQDLVSNHNVRSADRINLIFVPVNFSSMDDFRARALQLLAWDGPTMDGLGFGPFAVEPFRSNKSKFNVFYDDSGMIQGNTIVAVERGIQERRANLYASSNLPNLIPIFVNWQQAGINTQIGNHATGFGVDYSTYNYSNLTNSRQNYSFSYITRERLSFARTQDSHVSVVITPRSVPIMDANSFAHELGHAIFGLRDEKTDTELPGNVPIVGPPNCIATRAEAESLWGDMVGLVDPFFYEWRSAVDSALRLPANTQYSGLPAFVATEEDLRVGYNYGQCDGNTNEQGVIRPTRLSIMNGSSVAVFGSVNRRQAETVLGLFSGR